MLNIEDDFAIIQLLISSMVEEPGQSTLGKRKREETESDSDDDLQGLQGAQSHSPGHIPLFRGFNDPFQGLHEYGGGPETTNFQAYYP